MNRLFQNINKSLFLKLALLIVLSSSAIFVIIMIVNNHNLRRRIFDQQEKYYRALAKQSALKIDMMLFKAKTAVDIAGTELRLNPITRTNSLHLLRDVLHHSPMIGGSAIALAPDCDVKKTGFRMLYAWKENGKIKVADRISPEKDYKSDWFKIPYTRKKAIWTDPYRDKDIHRLMVTYSAPVIINGRVVAIITCDLILDSIDAMLANLELGRRGTPIITTRTGRIISYTNKDWVLKSTILDIGETLENSVDRKTLTTIYKSVINKKTDCLRVKALNSGDMAWIYFDTVPNTEWRIGFIIPEKTILLPITQLNAKMLYTAILGIVALLIPAFFVSHSITQPLKKICNAADSLAAGDFDAPIPKIKRKDEVGRLVSDFDKMRIDLKQYITTLAATTAEKERITSELTIAKDIQHGILPKRFPPFPKHAGLDIFAMLNSAREVGGDLYDFAIFDDDKLYICIGDVSGKGVPAALFMAIGKTLLKSTILALKDPAKALFHVNNELSDNNDSCMFITLFCGIMDLKTNKLVYANAGHNPPVIINSDGAVFLDVSPAPPLAVVQDIQYKNNTVQLTANDKFLMYTDGVTEAQDCDKNLFGEKQLIDILSATTCKTAEKYIYNIRQAVSKFAADAEQSDDITMLCFSNNPNQEISNNLASSSASIVFTNHRSELVRLTAWLDDIGEILGWQKQFVMQLNLALEEWIINVISYAFPETGLHEIEVRLWQNSELISIQITDDGIPFDPTEHSPAEISVDLDDREIGGLGISFIKSVMDVFTYKREDDKNIVFMQKRLADQKS